MDHCEITKTEINVPHINSLVKSSKAGSIIVFEGTTRDTYNGHQVLHLSYECYEPMAKLELQKLITRAKALFDCLNIAIVHRFGQVSVGETSVCVAVGSVHRADGFNAAVYIMDEIKARLPIWKKEHLSDGSAWKQNPEFATTVSKLDNFDCA